MSTNSNPPLRRRRFFGLSPLGGLLAVALLAAVGTGAYLAGSSARESGPDQASGRNAAVVPAASPAGLMPEMQNKVTYAGGLSDGSGGSVPAGYTSDQQASQTVITDQTMIVKTGSLSLEVGSVDNALGQAQATIQGLGGRVDSSNRYGDGDNLTATVTYRLPVARWDDALSALQKLGSKIISEQTGTTDVTAQVVDLDARIANLRATESALQAIMARATEI
jgi:hypothetical protein